MPRCVYIGKSCELYRYDIFHPLTDVTISGCEINGRITVTGISLGSCVNEICIFHPELVRFGQMISDYLDGKRTCLESIPVDLSNCSPFQLKILQTARAVMWGETISYSRLASVAGYPRAVRAAASVMRKNIYPLLIPCHRVIRKSGGIGGFSGKLTGREVQLKRKLLELETAH